MGCIIITVAGLIMIKKWLILKERHFDIFESNLYSEAGFHIDASRSRMVRIALDRHLVSISLRVKASQIRLQDTP